MAEHTPGPWTVEDFGGNCLCIRGDVAQRETGGETRDRYNRIATFTQRDPHPVHGAGISPATTLANATLAATAPEMYTGLIEARSELRDLLEAAANAKDPDRPHRDVLDEVRANPLLRKLDRLIAKAGGFPSPGGTHG